MIRCLVSLPNAQLLDVDLDAKAKGQECLDRVCQMLGILECDYFGLQYPGPHGEKLWLNMRNPIRRQLGPAGPYRLQLRVKFFVPPHILLQDVTRYHLYLNVKQDLAEGRYGPEGDLLKELEAEDAASRYRLLQEVSALETFGVENFETLEPAGRLGVGPRGLSVVQGADTIKIPFSAIEMATHAGRCLFLSYVDQSWGLRRIGFWLATRPVASAAYRAVTEMHAFYSCETVRNAVTAQCCVRDLKSALATLLRLPSAPQDFVFDVRRTCREVYDHTRRTLYRMEASKEALNSSSGSSSTENLLEDQPCTASACQEAKSELDRLQNAVLCRVCMDESIGTVFSPCRHVVCCPACSELCSSCPLCRAAVEDRQNIFLPID